MGYFIHLVARQDSIRSGLPCGTTPEVVTSAMVAFSSPESAAAGLT